MEDKKATRWLVQIPFVGTMTMEVSGAKDEAEAIAFAWDDYHEHGPSKEIEQEVDERRKVEATRVND